MRARMLAILLLLTLLAASLAPATIVIVQANPFNSRLAVQVASTGLFNMGAFPDPGTGGSTSASWDLMYRWPQAPSTSFTTIRIDGLDTKLGVSALPIEPPTDIDTGTNRSRWQIGDIEVTQILQVVFNNQTGQEDVARIAYTVRNIGAVPHSVGSRVMIDTEINGNDGAVFRVPGIGLVTNETQFFGDAIPSVFQEFFGVNDSTHVAASTVRDASAMAPDRLVMAYWGHLYYGPAYDYTIDPNFNFTHPPTGVPDSAYALFWNPAALAPGDSRTYATNYGLAQLTVDLRPPLALGVTGPATLSVANGQYSPNPFDITATIFNNGSATATGVALTLNLPDELNLAGGDVTQLVGDLAPGEERQIFWRAAPYPFDPNVETTVTYSVTASASNAASKTVDRQIIIPPLGSPTADCVSSTGSWANSAIAAQTGAFTVEFDATPDVAPMDGVIGFSANPAAAYTDLAAIVRFAPEGVIDARNGGAYQAASQIRYTAGARYHFRLAIDIPSHTYAAYVTPPGGAEQVIGATYAFRSQQSSVGGLGNLGLYAKSGSHQACNVIITASGQTTYAVSGRVTDATSAPLTGVAISSDAGRSAVTDSNGNYTLNGIGAGSYTILPSRSGYTFAPSSLGVSVPPSRAGLNFVGTPTSGGGCITSAGTWQNTSIAAQTGNFMAEFDATPNTASMDGVIGFAANSAAGYADLAAIVRFAPGGVIDSRNGGAYQAAAQIPYTAGTRYHFRMVVHLPSHTYDAYVTKSGGAEQTIGLNYAFRTEQSGASQLAKLALYAKSGSHVVCNVAITPSSPQKFVYIALGDSYQSGEGTGSLVQNTNDYLAQVYENGSNYPQAIGPQINTYTKEAVPNGDACHRSLSNYAKLNRDLLKPGSDIILIDVTCSGAKIEPGDKPAIVGTSNSAIIDPMSQVNQALDRLSQIGLTGNDVDLVTVGMGGNDARFVDIIAACLIPNLVRRALQLYPDSPSEIEVLANIFASCENFDKHLIKTDDAINMLSGKESWAQGKLLDIFGHAHILQLNYPDILPTKKNAPAWCSGIRKEDIEYARSKATQIDKILADTVHASALRDPRIALVDLENAFGQNALCPPTADTTLANGINENNYNAELRRLLNLDGNGDEEARRLLDQVVADYNGWKQCAKVHYTPFGKDCDTNIALDHLKANGQALLKYLNDNSNSTILPNLIAPDGAAESRGVRFDRSKGLFHPNANGQVVTACYVRAVYSHGNTGSCSQSPTSFTDKVNGNRVGNAPIIGGFGAQLHIQIGGFSANSSVGIKLFSSSVDLGTVTSDRNGIVDTVITLPTASAGAHTIELQGNTPTGTGIHKRVRINYPGRPRSDGGYALYMSGFTPNDGSQEPEQVDIIYLGEVFETLTPDEDGGVFVELPLLDLLNIPDQLIITAKSRTSGTTITDTIDPIPSIAGIWASSTRAGALLITGDGTTVTGRVHSNADIVIDGSQTSFTGGTEYGTTMIVTGSTQNLPFARKVTPGDLPSIWQVADYRPGGVRAINAGANYHPIPATACSNGIWNVLAADVPAGVVYIPCAVTISGSNAKIKALIAAEGSIHIAGDNITADPGLPDSPALITAATSPNAIRVDGIAVKIEGTMQALVGGVSIAGAQGRYRCGMIAQTVEISGSGNSIPVDEQCGRNTAEIYLPLIFR